MKNDPIELVRGSGNLFRDFEYADADVVQLKAILAAEIIKTVDEQDLSVRKAHAQTGFAAADFSRIRNADLDRFTVDRLMTILNSLGSKIEVSVQVKHRETVSAPHI